MTSASSEPTIAQRLAIAVITPLVLVLVVGVALGAQILRLVDTQRWLDHTDAVVAKLEELETSVAEQEATFRGFMLTNDHRAFPPPDDSVTDLTHEIAQLVADNAPQVARAQGLARRYAEWRAATLAARAGQVDAKSAESLSDRVHRMTEIKAQAAAMVRVELDLRHERNAAAESAVTTTEVVLVALVFGAGALLAFLARRQLGDITKTYGAALTRERDARVAVEATEWVRKEQIQLAEALQGDLTTAEIGRRTLGALVRATGATVGAFYAVDGQTLRREAAFALDPEGEGAGATLERGEGLVGQAAVDLRVVHLEDVPADYFDVTSGTGAQAPAELLVVPAVVDGAATAVVELGFLRAAHPHARELLERVAGFVATTTRVAAYRHRLNELLAETQQQADALQRQQEQLRVTNEELEEQTRALHGAHADLERQQVELEEANANLEQQAGRLEEQREHLVAAQGRLTEKATELERTSQYKSEFVANMSHELRTPLNSSLILARLLADNKEGSLTPEQVKFAETIYAAGNDLLALINDILDLAKIEAGKLDVRPTKVAVRPVVEGLERAFKPIAAAANVALHMRVDDDVPVTLFTDVQRLEQILRNLLSNALKFTSEGEVTLDVRRDGDHALFVVRDTGIGIPAEHQTTVFDAFQQVDGAATRKRGGTGLGLSISRDLARLLGGSIRLESEVGRGSTFALRLPIDMLARSADGHGGRHPADAPAAPPAAAPPPSRSPAREAAQALPDDRGDLGTSTRILLVVEDDLRFAQILYDLAHELDFKCVVATTADEAMDLAIGLPISGVVLDLNLPDHPGLAVLDRLKRSSAKRHVPVHVISVEDDPRPGLEMGAIGHLKKPATRDDVTRALRRLETTFVRPASVACSSSRTTRRSATRCCSSSRATASRRSAPRAWRRRSRCSRRRRSTASSPISVCPASRATRCFKRWRPTHASRSRPSSSTRGASSRRRTSSASAVCPMRSSSRARARPSGSSTR